jgi:two-component system, OmpR family, response regulator RegX3
MGKVGGDMHYNCLIVDDEKVLAESTCEYFNMFGVKTEFLCDAKECLQFLERNTVDLILLDVNLGQASGFDLCKKFRETLDIPILFISARTSDDDILIALNIGGDDYIKKPYSLSVLLAKVKVVLKRFQGSSKKEESTEDAYDNAGLVIDYKLGKVFVKGNEVLLKAMEYKLLTYFIKNKGRIIPKEELFQNVWEDSITGDGTLNVHVRHLREKIEENPNEPVRIKTVWGRGYVFEEI